MTDRTPRRTAARDSGLTLVELAVAGGILAVVMLAVGAILVGTMSAQRTVAAVTQTTTAAQAAVSEIATGVRNASELRLTTPSGSDQLLVTRTAEPGAALSWACRAWYYSASAGTIRSKQTADGTQITAPSATDLAAWTVVVSGVSPASGTAVFTPVSDGVRIAFEASISDGQPVLIETTAIRRTGVGEAGTCY